MTVFFPRRESLFRSLRELVKDVWALEPLEQAAATAPAHVKEVLLREEWPLYSFVEENQGCYTVVHTCVSEPLKRSQQWTRSHTSAMEAALEAMEDDIVGAVQHTAVVVVDGPVAPEVFDANIQSGRVHVIEACALSEADFLWMPALVDVEAFCAAENITHASELPRVEAGAPEVQLLRAGLGDILAYPPSSADEAALSMRSSGQHYSWTARTVVAISPTDALPDTDAGSSSDDGSSSSSSGSSSSSSPSSDSEPEEQA